MHSLEAVETVDRAWSWILSLSSSSYFILEQTRIISTIQKLVGLVFWVENIMVQASVITGSSEKAFSYLVKKEFRSSSAEGFFYYALYL